jgi:hypothetical protein
MYCKRRTGNVVEKGSVRHLLLSDIWENLVKTAVQRPKFEMQTKKKKKKKK